MATPTVQLLRILLARPGYLTAFRATSAMPQSYPRCDPALIRPLAKKDHARGFFVLPMTLFQHEGFFDFHFVRL